MSAQLEKGVKSEEQRGRSALFLNTLIIGLLLGASLGPALFLAVKYLELSGDLLFSFVVGVFAAFGVCLAIAGVSALLIVPRIFSSARGTLAAMVDDLTKSSRAYTAGDSTKAVEHFGRAVGEGVAWYSIGATRRFVAQAALGLLISFGGVLGAVLLLSQNSLLRDQNMMIKSQNEKIDKQLDLLVQQNEKIDQQTMVADSQKRGAFVSEMFTILQEVARADHTEGKIDKPLTTRIAVLTSSAVPYLYLDFLGDPGAPRRIPLPLSPERGQIIVALTRLKVNLSLLAAAGARFENADLRRFDLTEADLSRINLSNSDLSGSVLEKATLKGTNLTDAVVDNVKASGANFAEAHFESTMITGSDFKSANLDGAWFNDTEIKGGNFTDASFVGAVINGLSFENTLVSTRDGLPKGLPWPQAIQNKFNAKEFRPVESVLRHKFEATISSFQPRSWSPPQFRE
ncbi:pentapeptide repeat-containing protein [Bradyrhizobium sp. USDA 4486]